MKLSEVICFVMEIASRDTSLPPPNRIDSQPGNIVLEWTGTKGRVVADFSDEYQRIRIEHLPYGLPSLCESFYVDYGDGDEYVEQVVAAIKASL